MTTPLEREILTHFYITTEDYDYRGSNLRHDIVRQFVARGLLIEENGKIRGNDAALEPYMDALAEVPLPVMKWIVPKEDA